MSNKGRVLRPGWGMALLWLVAAIWGGSYPLLKVATNAGAPAGMINAWRGFIAAGAILICFFPRLRRMRRVDLRVGLIAGVINYLGFQFGTTGLMYTTPAKNRFLTATYVAMIPLIAWAWEHQRPQKRDLVAVGLCLLGMILITNIIHTGLHLQLGDFLTIIAAFFYGVQIVYYGLVATDIDPWILVFWVSLIQGAGGLLYSVLFERAQWPAIDWGAAWLPLVAVALGVTFVSQLLQVIGQRAVSSTTAGLILMTESLFAGILSVLFHFEPLTWSLVLGGACLIIANLIAQLDLTPAGAALPKGGQEC